MPRLRGRDARCAPPSGASSSWPPSSRPAAVLPGPPPGRRVGAPRARREHRRRPRIRPLPDRGDAGEARHAPLASLLRGGACRLRHGLVRDSFLGAGARRSPPSSAPTRGRCADRPTSWWTWRWGPPPSRAARSASRPRSRSAGSPASARPGRPGLRADDRKANPSGAGRRQRGGLRSWLPSAKETDEFRVRELLLKFRASAPAPGRRSSTARSPSQPTFRERRSFSTGASWDGPRPRGRSSSRRARGRAGGHRPGCLGARSACRRAGRERTPDQCLAHTPEGRPRVRRTGCARWGATRKAARSSGARRTAPSWFAFRAASSRWEAPRAKASLPSIRSTPSASKASSWTRPR